MRTLMPIQAWALNEAHITGGMVAPIGVGHGKTGVDILVALVMGVRTAALLVPAQLRAQLTEYDYPMWAVHWNVPNLNGSRYFVPGKCTLHVLSYNELSGAKNSSILSQIDPDLIIADEAHNLRATTAARTKRFLRHFHDSENPSKEALAKGRKPKSVKLVALSGTLTSRSIKDYAHLSQLALGKGSPLPLHYPTVVEWASAVDKEPVEDPFDFDAPELGAMAKIAMPGETARQAYMRRLRATQGVVSSSEGALGTSLVIAERKAPPIPESVRKALINVERLAERPDGEIFTEQLQVAACLREIAAGFFYRWRFPRNEPDAVKETWLKVRKEYRKEVREKLKSNREHMDSPLLLHKAAERWHKGYVHLARDDKGTVLKREVFQPHVRNGPMPSWDSEHWPKWQEVKDTVQPEPDCQWLDSYLAEDAAAWLVAQDKEGRPGIVWYEHASFGASVARLSGAPNYGGGAEASSRILQERATRGIVASRQAHGTGKNLQSFSIALSANVPSDPVAWEQKLGRLHRPGQTADQVDWLVYLHTPRYVEALLSAQDGARYIQNTLGTMQKLCYAQFAFTLEDAFARAVGGVL
jgi:hypothetical protein